MNTSSKFLMLQSFPILKHLSEKDIDRLARISSFKKCNKGEKVYLEGDSIEFVYFVEKGNIELGAHSSCGKMLIKDIVYEKDIFGENMFTEANSRNEFAHAMTDNVQILMIPASDFKSTVESNFLFANEVMKLIVTRLKSLERRVENFVFKKAKSRIADFIISTAKKKGIKIGIDECLINHGMSHKEIACLTDTSRQTVARVLGDFKRANLIHFSPRKPSKILIRDFAGLKM